MLALAIAIICTTSFSLVIRQTQRQGLDQFAVMGINYAAASLAGFAAAGGDYGFSAPTLHLGLIGGATFVTTYIVLIHSMDLKGVAIANAITRLAVLIPVLATILVWGERPGSLETAGAVLALLAMPLLSLDKNNQSTHLSRRQIPLLLALFMLNGMCLLMSKWFHATGLSAERPLYFGVLFGTAAIASLGFWLIWSRRGGWRELVSGVPLGLINYGTGLAVIMALDTLPGSVVFPVFAALSLALTTGLAAWMWGEVPGRRGRYGLAVALVAVVFVNLRP